MNLLRTILLVPVLMFVSCNDQEPQPFELHFDKLAEHCGNAYPAG